MSHTYVEVRAFPQAVEPRGARLVDLILSMFRWAGAAAKAHRSNRAQEALAVRELALSLQHSDPAFAADLMAAAARHESLDDEPARG